MITSHEVKHARNPQRGIKTYACGKLISSWLPIQALASCDGAIFHYDRASIQRHHRRMDVCWVAPYLDRAVGLIPRLILGGNTLTTLHARTTVDLAERSAARHLDTPMFGV